MKNWGKLMLPSMMMVTVLVVVLLPRPTLSAIGLKYANHPDIPDVCYDEEAGFIMKEGSEWYEPHCVMAYCGRRDGDMIINYVSCGAIGGVLEPGCEFKADNTKLYPDCCKTIVCPQKKSYQG